jgi:hypothetical protein
LKHQHNRDQSSNRFERTCDVRSARPGAERVFPHAGYIVTSVIAPSIRTQFGYLTSTPFQKAT